MTSTLPSVEPPSTTMYSIGSESFSRTQRIVSSRNRARAPGGGDVARRVVAPGRPAIVEGPHGAGMGPQLLRQVGAAEELVGGLHELVGVPDARRVGRF